MDFRSINTRNRIFRGFIKVLEEKRFSECTTSDILNYAEISKSSRRGFARSGRWPKMG